MSRDGAAPGGRTPRHLVVEADGGSRGNPGPAGFGALVRDAGTGELLAEVAESVGVATNNVAEYGGLVAGLRAAAAIDPQARVDVRMDSRLVVEQMSGRWQIRHEDMRRLAAEARQVLPPERVRYTWVPRDRNAHADRLANAAMDAAAAGAVWLPGPDLGGPATTGAPASAAVPEAVKETTMTGSAGPAQTQRLAYRLLTGTDDRSFCEKVSAALADGYRLYGGPAVAVDGERVVTAQAVVLLDGPVGVPA